MSLAQQALDDQTGVGVFARILSVIAAVGITSWTDFAAFLGAIYSACLLAEFLWKRVGRPFCERRGWLQTKRNKRKEDRT